MTQPEMARRSFLRCALWIALAFWGGSSGMSCGGGASHAARPALVLLAPAEVAGQWMAHQRITARVGDSPEAHAFEAAVQKDAAQLTIVGLTPMRTRLFTLVQTSADPDALALELALPDSPLPFPPALMVRDVQRVFFVALPGAPLSDGLHQGRAPGGERLRELWQDGRLRERRFATDDDRELAVIRFAEPGWLPGTPPPTIELADREHDYTLTLETLAWEALEAAPGVP